MRAVGSWARFFRIALNLNNDGVIPFHVDMADRILLLLPVGTANKRKLVITYSGEEKVFRRKMSHKNNSKWKECFQTHFLYPNLFCWGWGYKKRNIRSFHLMRWIRSSAQRERDRERGEGGGDPSWSASVWLLKTYANVIKLVQWQSLKDREYILYL